MSLNDQLEKIRQSQTVAMADRVAALKAAGSRVIGLQTGDPDFPTPPQIAAAALRAIEAGATHYAPSRGLPETRRAAALQLQRDNGLEYDPDTEILITHGGIHAYYLALQSILNPGDEVLIPGPSWATHTNMVLMLRGSVRHVPAPEDNGFIPPFAAWERAVSAKTRAIVLNYPANPTGAYPSREYMQSLQGFARAHDLWVVSDEVYENLYYDERPVSAAAFDGAKERTLLVHSLSKTYAMTGWRVGYLAAPARVVENAIKAGQNSITCVAPFVQKAAAFALSDPAMQQAAQGMRAAYAARRELVMRLAAGLESDLVRVTPPRGAFYYFIDMRALGMPSAQIAERLLDDAGVAVMPGTAFGEQGEGFLRMTIAASDADVEQGFRRIVEWAERSKP